MKIFSASQIRAWDSFTIEREPIASLELMNRAAQVFADWFLSKWPDSLRPIVIFCGTGNNGGDGVAVARLLQAQGFVTKIVVFDLNGKHSPDFDAQVALLPKHGNVELTWLDSVQNFPEIPADALIVDALFGSGLNRPLDDEWAKVIAWLNRLPNERISIDLPSGLFPDAHTPGDAVVQANFTFSFERPKRAFFFPENAGRVGEWAFGSIGLHPEFEKQTETEFHFLTLQEEKNLIRPRQRFAHKGSFGHALLIAGSFGKMGASVLAAQACLRAGAGLLTVHAPRCGYLFLQTVVPEAMFSADRRARFWTEVPDLGMFSAIGIGPGIGKSSETAQALENLLHASAKPLVLDADALNLLSENPNWWPLVPRDSILTPHPKEFERLFGKSGDDFERNDLQRQKARELGVFILLKGAHTAIACPDGECWFNSTGNPGMATGGSGDVLTGILTGLLAQGYSPKSAVLLGTYLHGLAGDLAAAEKSQEGMTAGDLVEFLGRAWLEIQSPSKKRITSTPSG